MLLDIGSTPQNRVGQLTGGGGGGGGGGVGLTMHSYTAHLLNVLIWCCRLVYTWEQFHPNCFVLLVYNLCQFLNLAMMCWQWVASPALWFCSAACHLCLVHVSDSVLLGLFLPSLSPLQLVLLCQSPVHVSVLLGLFLPSLSLLQLVLLASYLVA